MTHPSPSAEPTSQWSRVLAAAKLLWPAAFVFVAFDLAVSPDVSIMKSSDRSTSAPTGNLQIASLDELHNGLPTLDLAGETSDSDHMWFGVETTAQELAASATSSLTHLDGGWSGQFAGMLAEDVENACWSPYEVNLRLKAEGDQIFGPGSYVVDPSACSGHSEPVVSFFNASGERTGDQVSLVIVDDVSHKTTMLFNGFIAGDKIVGAFSMPNGAPASGTTVLELLDPAS